MLRVIECVAAALIPVLVIFISQDTFYIKVTISFLGFIVTVAVGIIFICKFQERWIKYRTTAEVLKHHKYLFLTKSKPYDGENSFTNLVETVEGAISKENTYWANYIGRHKANE